MLGKNLRLFVKFYCYIHLICVIFLYIEWHYRPHCWRKFHNGLVMRISDFWQISRVKFFFFLLSHGRDHSLQCMCCGKVTLFKVVVKCMAASALSITLQFALHEIVNVFLQNLTNICLIH